MTLIFLSLCVSIVTNTKLRNKDKKPEETFISECFMLRVCLTCPLGGHSSSFYRLVFSGYGSGGRTY